MVSILSNIFLYIIMINLGHCLTAFYGLYSMVLIKIQQPNLNWVIPPTLKLFEWNPVDNLKLSLILSRCLYVCMYVCMYVWMYVGR